MPGGHWTGLLVYSDRAGQGRFNSLQNESDEVDFCSMLYEV